MTELSTLYDTDYSAWTLQTAELIRAGRFAELDIEHLLTELSDMSKSERNELANRLLMLIAYLLQWEYQNYILSEHRHDFDKHSWECTIIEQRIRLALRLRKSPGLKAIVDEVIAEFYPDAVDLASDETRLPITTFPTTCSYTLEQLLDKTFYPQQQPVISTILEHDHA